MTSTISSFPARDVLDVLAGVPDAMVDGGWGVDALIGAQTREHGDLDLVVPLASLDATLDRLLGIGFAVVVDERPTRIVVDRGDGARVDLHPVTPSDTGLVQALPGGRSFTYALGLATGRIDGCEVPCVPAPVQVLAHCGYDPRPVDRTDLSSLREHAGQSLPPPYIAATGDEPIRRASADDAAALVAVRHRSWKSGYAGVMPQAVLDALDSGASLAMMWPFLREPPTPRHCALVAGDPGSVVGLAVMGPSPEDADVPVVYQLYVDPTAFGRGIGKRLLASATEWLRQRGFAQLTLWVLEGHTDARRFYEREGWRADGARKTETQPEGSWTSVRYRIPSTS